MTHEEFKKDVEIAAVGITKFDDAPTEEQAAAVKRVVVELLLKLHGALETLATGKKDLLR